MPRPRKSKEEKKNRKKKKEKATAPKKKKRKKKWRWEARTPRAKKIKNKKGQHCRSEEEKEKRRGNVTEEKIIIIKATWSGACTGHFYWSRKNWSLFSFFFILKKKYFNKLKEKVLKFYYLFFFSRLIKDILKQFLSFISSLNFFIHLITSKQPHLRLMIFRKAIWLSNDGGKREVWSWWDDLILHKTRGGVQSPLIHARQERLKITINKENFKRYQFLIRQSCPLSVDVEIYSITFIMGTWKVTRQLS